MRSSILLSALYLACSSVPALALTEGQAWVNFYEECPSEIVEIEEVTLILSSIESNSGERAHSASAPIASSSVRATPARSSSVMLASSALASASASASASATPSSMKSQSSKSLSSNHSRRSKFRSVLAIRSAEKETTLSPPVNITQGECQTVPIATAKHIDSSSVSVGGQLLTVTPFQECNITLHEVPGCIDEPLLVAPVKNRVAQSSCTPRNFGAFNDVWVRLDCSEIGTESELDAAEMSDSIIQSVHRIS